MRFVTVHLPFLFETNIYYYFILIFHSHLTPTYIIILLIYNILLIKNNGYFIDI